jgi:TRAP transporter 4TM/12TM fusion protein
MIFIVYAFVSPYLTGVLYYRGIKPRRFIEQLYLTFQGIFGEALNITATFVILFVLFGAFLEVSGGGEFFIDFSKCLVGRMKGGPGLMAVVASSLMGTISGSAVANVATNGVFTIPLMRKTGYEKNFAGAVEAVASSGGQIMPPVMGAGAFIMSEYIGIPYIQIIKHALIPAILFYLAVFLQVYFVAHKTNLKGFPKDEICPVRKVLWMAVI